MAATRHWVSSHRPLAIGIVITAVVLFGAVMIGVADATDEPSFCAGSCHEMRPFHAAWQDGPHANVSCVECHVDPGTPSRVAHKLVAMQEVWAHLTEEPKFPQSNPTVVPDSRCLRCHESPKSSDPNFDHAAHAANKSCQTCHATAGHKVTAAALREANIFNESHAESSVVTTSFAKVDEGVANIAGHKLVSCERCHDMAATGCVRCHTAEHEDAGPAAKTAECSVCHKPGRYFTFTHPSDRKDCASCHEVPKEDHDHGTECASCHATGVSFAFRHPKSNDCASCHDRPEEHRAGKCVTCHKARGKSWAFKHPGGGSACTDCHSRPANHRGGACVSCHRTGTSWRFVHTGRGDCRSCHSAPSGHYGSTCSSCHSPGRSWSSASFRHPGIPGGEHSYRSFRCKACHPGGYGSHACNTCHDGGGDD